ncbi:MAG: ExeM/NucH family extracellular endonuclease [Rubrivivax sp.]|nr:ExeM/NucH family extracellular endonuclease [Rubrivivax sp.]
MTFCPHRPAALARPLAARLAAFTLALSALGLAAHAQAAVVVSQVYGGGGNTGATLQHDFIEIFNNGSAAESVGGWSVQYASATGGTWQVTVIPAGTTVPAGGYLLVRQAAGAAGTVPVTGDVTGSIAMAAANGKVALANTATPLSGTTPVGGALVDIVSYGTANGTEGTATGALSATTAALRNGNGCTDTNNNSVDFSIGAPAPRSSATAAAPCAGGGGGGGGGGGATPVAATIPDIQGSGVTSPLAGQLVSTSGVVTRLLNNGFFIQDLTGDGNPATSDGLFVFTSTAPPAAAQVGNLVQVTGSVVEFASGAGTAATPLTEITSVTAVDLLGSGYSLAPTPIALPLAVGESLERYEGMLVSIAGTLTVQQNFVQARFGQLTLGVGRHENPTNRHRPGAMAQALAEQNARSRLLLDDGSSLQNVNPTPYFGGNGVPRAGDTVGNLIGVLDFGLASTSSAGPGLYRLQPIAAPLFTASNARPAAPAAVGGNVKLGAMNVLNFFTTFTNGETASGQTGQGCTLGGATSAGNCRGANNITEFGRQRSKIVRALAGLNADAVGLMEIQNNGNVAAQNLVDALNATVGAGTYATVPPPAAGTGTDAIRVAMIYKPARLVLVGGSASDTDAVNNRPTLAQTFAGANGERFTLVVNHLKSKGSCPGAGDADAAGNVDSGDGQGCWNAVRLQQAQRLRTFVAQLQAASGNNDVLLVGDMNAYGQEDPIHELTSNGFVDQALRSNAFAYSYVFDATAGRLDHAISTATMSPKVTGAGYWHINADEQLAYDYNLEFKQPACATCAPDPYTADAFRSSDHDPVLLGLNLYKTFTGTAGRDSITGTPGDDILNGGGGADTLTGGNGQNIYLYSSIRDAGDSITDFVPGKDLIDVGTLLATLGYTGSNPVADGWIRFVALARNATSVEIDTDGPGPGTSRSLATLLGVSAPTLVATRDLKLGTRATDSRRLAAR